MPQVMEHPKCIQCEKTETQLWRNTEIGCICHECYTHQEQNQQQNEINIKDEIGPQQCCDNDETAVVNGHHQPNDEKSNTNSNSNSNSNNNNNGNRTRKSNRSASTRLKKSQTNNSKMCNIKGRGRRFIFKKNVPYKSPTVPASIRVVESVFFNGSYMQVGDIVSLMDNDDNLYYAQIRGLLVDTFCEKSAFITWLIPTTYSPPANERFDPSTYLIGPEEDMPRRLSCLRFVMHAPSNYYHDKNTPYPIPDSMDFSSNSMGFIWTRLHEQAISQK